MKKLAQELLKEAGYYSEYDNRNRAIRGLNLVLNSDLVKIDLQTKGRIWTNPSVDNGNFKFNIEISGGGIKSRIYARGIDPYVLLKVLGEYLLHDKVKEKIDSKVSLNGSCAKCGGSGIIPAFYYYANGVCFDCMGSGRNLVKDNIKKIKSKI